MLKLVLSVLEDIIYCISVLFSDDGPQFPNKTMSIVKTFRSGIVTNIIHVICPQEFQEALLFINYSCFILSTSSLQSYNSTNNKLVQNSYFTNLLGSTSLLHL